MRIAPGMGLASNALGSMLAAVAAGALLAGCTVSGPSSLGETGSVKQSAPGAAPAAASAPATAAGEAPAAAPAAKQAPVKVALLLPLSGPPQLAAIAKGMKQAGELALFDLDNPSVQLVVKDDKGTPDGARAAAEEAVKDGAELILGPLLAKAVAGASPVARAANVPVVAFSNDTQVAGNGVYLLSFLARPEIDRVVAYAVLQGRKRFAALLPGETYGQALEESFRAAITRSGGALVARETMAADASSMVEPVQRLAEAIRKADEAGQPIDALIVPGGQETLAALAPLLATTGLDLSRVKLIGTGGWDLPAGVREDALAGTWYAGPDPRGWRDFAERFAKTYGTPPPRLSTLAYDGVGLAVALSANPPRARFTPANLTRGSGFAGADGQFRLLASGLSERALAVLELQKFGVNVVEPAPGSLNNAALERTAN